MRARRPGVCRACEQRFEAGEVIAYRPAGGQVLCEACIAARGVTPLLSASYMHGRPPS